MALITSRPTQGRAPTGPGRLIDSFYSQDVAGSSAAGQIKSQVNEKLEEKNLRMQPSMWREDHEYPEAKRRGTSMYKLIESGNVSIHRTKKQLAQIEKRMGSRPPLCSNKCNACNPCEAVQVPTPLLRPSRRRPGPRKQISTASIDPRTFIHVDYSNYQPEGWKCKCGSLIYNP
ncbi:hypothetical protein GOP47_0003942 [Adiantum capillus-veneris]|uniref:Epidermal patterning factor-like protein n=1 Tax=Adiantum capillus-veneris TaxID=13818 RepID=A0A9D4V6M9_ADICA|nr:hypothetical protein GOP47_0003942 [Adiantum capillus-veneris]